MTTFCLEKKTLNARPLTPVSCDPNDFDALCQNHFLLGRPSSRLPSMNPALNDFDHRKHFARAEAFANAISLDQGVRPTSKSMWEMAFRLRPTPESWLLSVGSLIIPLMAAFTQRQELSHSTTVLTVLPCQLF